MPIDLHSLTKLENVPGSVQTQDPAARVVVLVRLHPGAERPAYIAPRAQIAPDLFSAEIPAGDLKRIENDPAVASMALSRTLPMID